MSGGGGGGSVLSVRSPRHSDIIFSMLKTVTYDVDVDVNVDDRYTPFIV